MDKIGIVNLRDFVKELSSVSGLPMEIKGFPVPPHRVFIGDVAITGESGSPDVVKDELLNWFNGYLFCQRKMAASALKEALSNDPPHVIVDVSFDGVVRVHSDTPNLVAITVDRRIESENGDEAFIVSEEVDPTRKINGDGVRACVIEMMEELGARAKG